MGVLLPRIGVTGCERAEILLQKHPESIVGTFWVMPGYGFDDEDIPSWWVDIVLKENQAQAILDAYESRWVGREHGEPVYLGFCIIVTADKNNPANLSYVVQHLRMFEGLGLLRTLAKHNIPAHTEVAYPRTFLTCRYGFQDDSIPEHLKTLYKWNVQMWEDYCSYLMAEHGQEMIEEYWLK